MIQLLSDAKSETIIHHGNIDDCGYFFIKPSTFRLHPILEPVLEPFLNLVSDDNVVDNIAMELSDFNDEGIHVIIVNRNQDLPTPQLPTNNCLTLLYPYLTNSSERSL